MEPNGHHIDAQCDSQDPDSQSSFWFLRVVTRGDQKQVNMDTVPLGEQHSGILSKKNSLQVLRLRQNSI